MAFTKWLFLIFFSFIEIIRKIIYFMFKIENENLSYNKIGFSFLFNTITNQKKF